MAASAVIGPAAVGRRRWLVASNSAAAARRLVRYLLLDVGTSVFKLLRREPEEGAGGYWNFKADFV